MTMEMNRRKLLVSLFAGGLAAATTHRASASEPPFSLVVTTAMLADAARAIGGDRVEVQGLMGEGVDPHGYRQTRSDIAAMVRADAVIWHGLYLEAQLEEFLLTLSKTKTIIAVAERAIPHDMLISHPDYPDRYDPHVWMDTGLWALVVRQLAFELGQIMPDHASLFLERAEAYAARLDELGAYAGRVLATVPREARVLVTAHDAFGYFGRAHDFEVMGIQGLSTESEAGLARIEELVSIIVEREIGAIFVESSVSDRNVRALIEGAAARGRTVQIGGQLYSDSMGRPGTYEGTYFGMIDHNVTVIARALGGDAPPTGMANLLTSAD
jgi:manganese/zinc/iron transport system substrate-binding protein